MKQINKKTLKIVAFAMVYLATIILSCVCTFFITKANCQSESAYELAMDDAIKVDENEITQLVSITKDSDMVTWDSNGDKVLMLSWHKYPDSYKAGNEFVCQYGEVWTFTDKEMQSWYTQNCAGVSDWDLRFEQLLGLPADNGYTHFTAFWVDEEELIRPAYQTDIAKQVAVDDLKGGSLGAYEEWFNANIIGSYVSGAYPWTRLGYTYDWTNDGNDYGLTEFIILENSTVEVEWTVTTAEFINMLGQDAFA